LKKYAPAYRLFWSVFDVASREKEIIELEKKSAEADFWAEQNQARSVMRRLAEQKKMVEQWRSLEKKTADIAELINLATEESDNSFTDEIGRDIGNLAKLLDKLELELAFSGEYDSRSAILQIHAGAGGTESQDWAEMLLRMYLRWA